MTVKELMDILATCNPTDKVLVAKDAEGNGYHELEDCSTDYNCELDGYGYEIGLKSLDNHPGYGEEDLLNGEPCVVLWP